MGRGAISVGELEAGEDAFLGGPSSHLIRNLCLDPKGAQAPEVMNT